jgi:hypothetical protein
MLVPAAMGPLTATVRATTTEMTTRTGSDMARRVYDRT